MLAEINALYEGGAFSVLDWRSVRARRVCRSTLAAEIEAMDAGLDAAMHLRQLWAEVLLEDYRPSRDKKPPKDFLPILQTTDCKSLFDTLTKDGAPSLPSERRLAVDLAALADICDDYGWEPRDLYKWIPFDLQLGDYLTKCKATYLFRSVLDIGTCALHQVRPGVASTVPFLGKQGMHMGT